jgi:hypothetical protein
MILTSPATERTRLSHDRLAHAGAFTETRTVSNG